MFSFENVPLNKAERKCLSDCISERKKVHVEFDICVTHLRYDMDGVSFGGLVESGVKIKKVEPIYPIDCGKAYDYFLNHSNERIKIVKREPRKGQQIVWNSGRNELKIHSSALYEENKEILPADDFSARVSFSTGIYGQGYCTKKNIYEWMPIKDEMKAI